MKKNILAALLLSLFAVHFSPLMAQDVVLLESASGTGSEYSVAELLRVELSGDYIRFIARDGSVAAEVYKYDYIKLTVDGKQSSAVETAEKNAQPSVARKVIMNGQVYILLGDKAYRIDGSLTR
jgi:hypothetical protein